MQVELKSEPSTNRQAAMAIVATPYVESNGPQNKLKTTEQLECINESNGTILEILLPF